MPANASSLLRLAPVLGLAAFTGAVASQTAQPSASDALGKARSLYYLPVDKGLQSFHCEVRFDWKDLLQKATTQQVPDDDDRLRYLRSVNLTIDDDLHGTGELHWQAPAPPPDNTEDSVNKLRDGLRQIWGGFFQTWNGFVTGDLTAIDAKATVEPTADGYRVVAHEASGVAEERYGKNLQLESVHISTTTFESTILPTFTPSAQGLLVTAIRSSYRQMGSGAGAATEVKMAITYAPVGTYQLPSKLQLSVAPAQFDFQLTNCTVNSAVAHP